MSPVQPETSSNRSNHGAPNASFDKTNEYQASGLKNNLHGGIYQLKLLMWFVNIALKNNYQFRLATELDSADKFDDLVFQFKPIEQNRIAQRFLQPQHRLDESKKIKDKDLWDGDFNLQKYFISFRKIKKKFASKGDLQDFILCTNINLDLENMEIKIEKIEQIDDFFPRFKKGKKEGARYKLSSGEPIEQNLKIYEKLRETSNIHMFAKTLVEHIKNQKQLNLTIFIINVLVEEKIIEIKVQPFTSDQIKIEKEYIGKFNEGFINYPNNSNNYPELTESAKKFREIIQVHLDKTNGLKLDTDTELKLYSTFKKEFELYSNTQLFNDYIKDDEITEFLEKLIFSVNQPNVDELSDIIKKEMGDNHKLNLLNASLVTDSFEIKTLDWLKGKAATWISHENVKDFFDSIGAQVNTFITVGLSTTYPEELKRYGIEFKIGNIALKNFLKTDGSKQIFNLVTVTDTVLCAIKVLKTINLTDVSEKFKQQDSYIFIRLKTFILPKIKDIVLKAFASFKSHNLLVINCDSEVKVTEGDTQELYKKLYNILKNSNKKIILITKENDALAKTFETEYECKDKFERSDADHTLLTDLTESSQLKLLEKPVVLFQGENISFDALIDKSDEESKKIINSDTLLNLIKNKQIKVGNNLIGIDEIKDYYISRSMYTQVNFNQTKFEEDIKYKPISDLLVINGTKLASKNNIFVFDNNNYESAAKKFNELCVQNEKSNIHWLKCELGKLVLHKSYGSIFSLVKYRETDKYDNTCDETSKNVLTETEFLVDKKSKIIIISGTAGMGKTTVLSSLSMEIKKKFSSIWVIRIDLRNFTKVFNNEIKNKNDFSTAGVYEVVDFLQNSLFEAQEQLKLTSNLEREIFKNCINGQGKIALLFDGFDEISPHYQNVVINLLQALNKTKVDKLFITTRPNMRELLETKLEVFSDILKPFSKPDQIDFLSKFWIKKLNLQDLNQERKYRLNTYAGSLVEKFSASINDKIQDFIGIPLQTMMLAEIFQGDDMQKKLGVWESCKEFIALDNTNKNPQLPETFDLPSLYGYFVEKNFYKFHLQAKQRTDFTKVGAKKNPKENYENFRKKLSIMALSVLVYELDLKILLSEAETQELNSWMKDIEIVEKNEGIIDKILDSKPNFVHRTFAEYFASFALVEKQDLKSEIVCCIINDIIDPSPVFISSIYALQDDLCKTILHYAVEYNKENIIVSVLNYKNVFLKNNILLHGSFKNENILNSNFVEFVNKKDNQGKTALDYAEHSKLNIMLSLELLLNGAYINRLTQKYKNKITNCMLNAKISVGSSNLLDTYAYQYNYYRPIQEKLLIVCPEKFLDLQRKEQSRLLSYFFLHGRVKVIDTLLSSITDEKRRKLLVNADDEYMTPLDRVNSSDQISDDERLKITKYLFENGGKEVKMVIGLSDKSSNSYITNVLQAAAQCGHIKTFEYFIHLENFIYYNLHFSLAAKNQQLNIVEYLMVNHKHNIKFKGNTPLHIAVESEGSLKIIKSCIDIGEEINAKNDKGETPLFYAIHKRRLNLLKYLVLRGADVNIVDQQNYTVLNRAIEQDERDIINYLLLECKAKISFTSELIKNKIEFYKKRNEFNLDLDEYTGMPRLHSAIQLNELELVKFLIQQGADINITDLQERTALHWSSEFQQTEIVEMLLQHGAIFDAKDINNNTPLDLLSQSDSNKITWLLNVLKTLFNSQCLMQDLDKELVKIEPNSHLKDWGPYGLGHPNVWSSDSPMLFILNAKNSVEKTLLHIAAETNDLKALNVLLEFNYEYIGRKENPQSKIDLRYKYYQPVSIDAVDSFGNTPLHLAAEKGHEKVVDLLLEIGAFFNAQKLQRQTPEYLAKTNYNDTINNLIQPTKNLFFAIEQRNLVEVENCINSKAYINAKSINGRTPLYFAVASDQSDIVLSLLKRRANSEVLDIQNRTLLHLATANNKIEIVKLLLKHGAIFNAKDKWDKAPYEFKNNDSVNLLNAINKLFNYVQSDNPKAIIDYIKVIEKDFKLDIVTIFNIRDNQSNTILHHAAKSNDIEIAEFLFKSGAIFYAQKKIRKMAKSFYSSQDIFLLLDSIENMFKIIDYIYQGHKTVYPVIDMHVLNYKKNTLLQNALEYNKLYLVQRLLQSSADVNYEGSYEKTPLLLAVEKGMIEATKLLIEHGAEVNCKDKDEQTPLHYCAEKDMLDLAKFLIEHGAKVNCINKYGQTPLHYCGTKGMLDLAKLLIEHGAEVNCKENDEKTPLHYCAKIGMLDLAAFLIEHGANVNCINKCGKTPLHYCAEKGLLDLVKFLIEHGAEVNCKENDEQTPLHYCAKNGMSDIAKLLIEYGANIECVDQYAKTPLHYCGEKGILDIAKLLIKHGANVECIDQYGKTPLHYCGEKCILDLAKLLIDHGANVDCVDQYGKTPLHYCGEKGILDIAKLLIKHGANVECVDQYGKTPLHYCGEKGMLDVAILFIEHGANVECVDQYSKTPLHYCGERGILDLTKLLIKHGANVECLDQYGKTPLHYCAQKGMLDLSKLLIKHGAKINCEDIYKQTPLHYCADQNMVVLAKLLIEHVAILNCRDQNGKTPLHICAEKGRSELAELLIKHGAEVNFKDMNEQTPLHFCAEKYMLDLAKLLIKHGAIVDCIDKYGKTPLQYSAEKNMVGFVKLLIENGANLNCTDKRGKTPLHYCAVKHMLELAKLLTKNGANVKCIDQCGSTPLHVCAKTGLDNIAKLLIEHGADVNCINQHRKTPLHYCAEIGFYNFTKLLIKHAANVNCIDINGKMPLHYCAKIGWLDLAKLLIEYGAKVNCKDFDEKTPLHYSEDNGMLDLAKLLKEHGAN